MSFNFYDANKQEFWEQTGFRADDYPDRYLLWLNTWYLMQVADYLDPKGPHRIKLKTED